MIKTCIQSIVFCLIAASTANASTVQVKFKLPEDLKQCTDLVQRNIAYSSSLSRDVAFVSHGLFVGWRFFYIQEGCYSQTRIEMNYPNRSLFEKLKSSEPGSIFHLTFGSSKFGLPTAIEGYAIEAEDPEYYNWKDVQEKEKNVRGQKFERARMEEVRGNTEKTRMDSLTLVPIPDFSFDDSKIGLYFRYSNLVITNKTTEFVLIKSISTYYNGMIYTIPGPQLELPPESANSNGFSAESLLSSEMMKSREVKVRDLENVKTKPTKFGFAIKYVINGTEGKIYSVHEYK